MKRLLGGLWAVVLFLAAGNVLNPTSTSASDIVSKQVEYTVDRILMKGCFAYDENIKGRRPGVLVVPEWWGVNDYACHRVRMLAGLGYAALAVDMYGGGKQATTPDEAGKLSSEVMKNFPVAKARFLNAMEFLKEQAVVDPDRIAAIGYCFGGGVVLNMARQGVDLRGVVSFHGGLTPVEPAKAGVIKAKILVLTGADDNFVPEKEVEAFRKEMQEAHADFRVISYPGAKHSFTNPEATDLGKKFKIPIAYDPKADRQSWEEMKGFLKSVFKR